MPTVDLGGTAVVYTVRLSKRAKRISVRYSPRDGLEVVYPLGIISPPPEELLKEKSAWVLAAVARFREAADLLPAREYRSGETFWVLGRPHTLQLRGVAEKDRVGVEITDSQLILSLPDRLLEAGRETRRKAVEAFYRDLALDFLPARVSELAGAHGFQYARVRVKNQKTRWGSCSSKGNINLNLRLMMAPEPAIDYVIVHELCHLRILNHSPAYWALVERCCPNYRRWRSWFKAQGANLIL